MSAFTILLPHRRNLGNDRSLQVCLSCLADNTTYDYKLIMDAAQNEPLYPRVNRMAEQADTELIVYWASDFFAAPGWDVPMLEAWESHKIITNIVVEPRAIAMHDQNLYNDFGRKPETFRREEFEEWSLSHHAPMLAGKGWYAPYLMSRQRFLELGGLCEQSFTDGQGFSNADVEMFNAHEGSGGAIERVKSYVYHLQRWSEIEEQEHPKRDIQSS